MTFGTKQMAQSCAATIEGEIEQLKASGFLKPAGLIVGVLIDRYIRELYPLKRWSASKTRDIRVVKRKLGADLVSCPANNLLDPPADFSVGQGAPTSHSGHYGEEAQRRPAQRCPAPSGSPRGTRRSE